MTKLIRWIRGNAIAITALILASGGGYAIAAVTTSSKTITACANKKTRVLTLSNNGRCNLSQRKIVWNQKGTPGVDAVAAWGSIGAGQQAAPGHGLMINQALVGQYTVTVTDTKCAKVGLEAPVVAPTTGVSPFVGPAIPVAFVGPGSTLNTFDVFAGRITNGAYTAGGEGFNVEVACGS